MNEDKTTYSLPSAEQETVISFMRGDWYFKLFIK